VVHNAPVKTFKHNDLTIEGYSRAAVQSYWRFPELKIGFDLGLQPWDFMGTATWFVTHTHLDHIAALPIYVSRRRMMKMDPPKIYLPAYAIDNVQRLLRAYSRLDRGSMPCELLPLEDGDTVELSRELLVTAHATEHRIPSLGYIVWERRRKLAPQYVGLSGEQIRDIRLSGKEVSVEKKLPKLAYLGDSQPKGLDQNPEMYLAEVLIAEMTFVAPGHRPEKIHKHGHMHLDDFVQRREKFQNSLIIASHFSTRYNNKQIRQWVEKAIPDMLDNRLHLWL
jgi:ribonuclease Z